MTQKLVIGLAAGVLVLGLVFAFVYRQFAESISLPREGALQLQGQPTAVVSVPEKKAALPATIDGISQSIQDETAMDLSALDDEANGEIMEIQADSDSVTNLSTSYDENSL